MFRPFETHKIDFFFAIYLHSLLSSGTLTPLFQLYYGIIALQVVIANEKQGLLSATITQ
jgi:hypothetical protein